MEDQVHIQNPVHSTSSREPNSNAHGGRQNNNTGNGLQFAGSTFNSNVNITTPTPDSVPNPQSKIDFLKRLNVVSYEDRKNRNPERVEGTCEWFVTHGHFHRWEKGKEADILWVSADPGCGKSVLAKHLVDSILLPTRSRIVCYFFFKDDFADQRTAIGALSCILHQIFKKNLDLLSDSLFKECDVEGEQLFSSFSNLWRILMKVAANKSAGEIICVLDALDECQDEGKKLLMNALCKFHTNQQNLKLKFLITSRPYGDIRGDFNAFERQVIHLSGESDEEMGIIAKEIDIFIKSSVQSIGARLALKQDDQDFLFKQLMKVDNRTYLWVHLVLNQIKKDISIDVAGLLKATSELPKTVDEAYNRILAKSQDVEKALRLLHIIVTATRPLTLREMALALELHEERQVYGELNPEREDRLRNMIRDVCGFFITIVNSKVYLLHQTAKEFLVKNDAHTSPKTSHRILEWKHCLQPLVSHQILAHLCIRYLLLDKFESDPLADERSIPDHLEHYPFLDYSAKNWAAHARELPLDERHSLALLIAKLCNTSSARYVTWFRVYWSSMDAEYPKGFTALILASYLGLSSLVASLLEAGKTIIDSQDETYKRTALCWAAKNGHDSVVAFLLIRARFPWEKWNIRWGKRANVKLQDRYGRTPLSYAALGNNLAIAKRLIKAKARADVVDNIDGTPISYALLTGNKDLIGLLAVDNKVNMKIEVANLLLSAVSNGDEEIVERLLQLDDIDVNIRDRSGHTPLSCAARNGHEAIVKVLLESQRVDPDSKDKYGQRPLSWAAENGHEAVVKVLLESQRVDPDSKDNSGQTPLFCAARNGHEAVVNRLNKALR